MNTFASRAITALGYLGAIGVGLVVFATLTARVLPVVDLFAQFLLPTITFASFLCIFAIVSRRWRLAATTAVLLATGVAFAWPYEQEVPTTAPERHFKLLAFNIYAINTMLSEVVTGVRAANADVVILLEVAPRNREALRALDQDYPHRIECWQKTRCDILILSRKPLRDLEQTFTVVGMPPAWAAAELDFGNCRFSLVAAHLSLPFPFHHPGEQGARAAVLSRLIGETPPPKIVAGDFNAAPWGAIVSDLSQRADLTLATGFGATWPTNLPQILGIPIDHVLASRGFTFLSRELRTIPGSDHRAVLTDIALPPQDQCRSTS